MVTHPPEALRAFPLLSLQAAGWGTMPSRWGGPSLASRAKVGLAGSAGVLAEWMKLVFIAASACVVRASGQFGVKP